MVERARRARRWWEASAVFLGIGGALAGSPPVPAARALDFDGRAAVEMEYLGQSYFSQQAYSDEDLGLPPGTSLLTPDTTRFHDDSWLPGPDLELNWSGGDPAGRTLAVRTATSANAETFSQDAEIRAGLPGGAGTWRLRADGSFLDDDRSLVGRGDWHVGADVERRIPWAATRTAILRTSWRHSRGRADSASYLYDYELVRVRAEARGGGLLRGGWEAHAEGALKEVPGGAAGSWREVRAGGERRGAGDDDRISLDLRARSYDENGVVGRDVRSLEAELDRRLAGTHALALSLEAGLDVDDYTGRDDLYFDAAMLDLHLPVSGEVRGWTVAAGPATELLHDLGGGSRDYAQGTLRASAERFLDPGGFLELDLEAGRRSYRESGDTTIEVASLSSSLTRTDYWLVDLFAVAGVPVTPAVSLELTASSSWEFHGVGSERIQITFVTLSAARRF